MSALKNALLTLMTLAMLFALALATPLGSLTENAQRTYLNEAPAGEDDEYAFLFDN